MDIDAASSVALARLMYPDKEKHPIKFLGSDVTKEEFHLLHPKGKRYLLLDIDCSGIGMKGTKKTIGDRTFVMSAFSLYLSTLDADFKEAFSDLANFIDIVDSKILRIEQHNSEWLTVFKALQRTTTTDEGLLEIWCKIIEGHYRNFMARYVAEAEAEKASWPFNNIAIIKNPKEHLTSKILMNKGADFVIYEEANNMGILISDKVSRSIAPELGRALPGWFVHPSGFIVAWGTKKAIKRTPSGFKPKELAQIVKGIYE
jgi:hypothetical protein